MEDRRTDTATNGVASLQKLLSDTRTRSHLRQQPPLLQRRSAPMIMVGSNGMTIATSKSIVKPIQVNSGSSQKTTISYKWVFSKIGVFMAGIFKIAVF